MTTMRAKFQVAQVHKELGREGEVQAIKLQLWPVVGTQGENATWSKFTPSGNLEMRITNKALFDTFRPGQEYYLDFKAA